MDEKPKQGFDRYAFLAWLETNRNKIIIGAIILATAALLMGLAVWKRDQDEIAASHALLNLQVRQPDATEAAPESYLSVARQYPRTAGAKHALLLAGQAYFAEGAYEEAQSTFQQIMDRHPNSPLLPQAMLGVAASLDARRQDAEAIARYQEVITRFPQTAAASQSRLALARLHELENQPEQALRLYDELIRTDDAWSGEARERRRQLLLDYPALRESAAPPPVQQPETEPAQQEQ
jgi:tetratricopeptide (TPR) repeat protein